MSQRKLQQQISELEANAGSQKFLSNLAAVKTPQASIFQQDDDTSKVLFRADPEDEFEVINVKGNWVHIRLENGTEGWIRGAQLQPPATATTVRVQDGRTLTTDGPFPETKEALGGYYLLEADDLDAAIELAARIPAARLGGAIEVRPLVER